MGYLEDGVDMLVRLSIGTLGCLTTLKHFFGDNWIPGRRAGEVYVGLPDLLQSRLWLGSGLPTYYAPWATMSGEIEPFEVGSVSRDLTLGTIKIAFSPELWCTVVRFDRGVGPEVDVRGRGYYVMYPNRDSELLFDNYFGIR